MSERRKFCTVPQWLCLTSYKIVFHHLASASMNPILMPSVALRQGLTSYVLLVRPLSVILNAH